MFAVARSRRPSPLKSPRRRVRSALIPVAVISRGLKRAVAVAQEHRDIVGIGVGHGQVDLASCRSRPRRSTDGFEPTKIDAGERERAVAVAFQDINALLVLESVTARSMLPVPKSPATMDVGVAPAGSSMAARPRNCPRPDWTGW